MSLHLDFNHGLLVNASIVFSCIGTFMPNSFQRGLEINKLCKPARQAEQAGIIVLFFHLARRKFLA